MPQDNIIMPSRKRIHPRCKIAALPDSLLTQRQDDEFKDQNKLNFPDNGSLEDYAYAIQESQKDYNAVFTLKRGFFCLFCPKK